MSVSDTAQFLPKILLFSFLLPCKSARVYFRSHERSLVTGMSDGHDAFMALPLHNLLQYNHDSPDAGLVTLFPAQQILLDMLHFYILELDEERWAALSSKSFIPNNWKMRNNKVWLLQQPNTW
jgi:hypothetical protein